MCIDPNNPPIIYINNMKFIDVTNITTSSPDIMNYEEAFIFATTGKRVICGNNYKKNKK